MLLPKLLLAAGLLFSGALKFSLVPECRGEEQANPSPSLNPAAHQDLERELLALTNQYRIRQGLRALKQDDALVQIAREHSAGMAAQGYISHQLPAGDLKARMNRAGYRYEIARENVARAPSVLEAQNALVASPGHASNILANDVTRVGIGVVRRLPPHDRELYITEIFASPQEEFLPAAVRDMYISQVTELAYQAGTGVALPDPALEKLASRSVLSLDMPLKKEQLQRLLADSSIELQNEKMPLLARIGLDVQLLYNPKNLRIPQQVREGQARIFGTAVRRVANGVNQPAYLILTLIGYTNN